MQFVSVLMPVRNGAKYVEAALNSIITQEAVKLEVIVVDDGSTDETAAVVQAVGDSRIRLIAQPPRGIAEAMNAGLDAAQGNILARCDADDLFVPGRLAWQTAWLAHHPEFGAVCGTERRIDAKGRLVGDFCSANAPGEITEELRNGKARACFNCWAIRAELVREVGGWRPFFATAEDLDLMLRLGERARVWYEPRLCYESRFRKTSITHTQGKALLTWYYDAALAFQAQRQCGRPDDLALGSPPTPIPDDSPPQAIRGQCQGILMGQSWRELERGHPWRAILSGIRACLHGPLNLAAWKNLAVLLLKSLFRLVKNTGPQIGP